MEADPKVLVDWEDVARMAYAELLKFEQRIEVLEQRVLDLETHDKPTVRKIQVAQHGSGL